MEIGAALRSSFDQHATRIAVVETRLGDAPREFSFQQVRNLAAQVSTRLLAIETEASPRPVALFLQRSAAHIAAGLAAISVGRPFFSLNPKLSKEQVTSALQLTGASHLVTDNACLLRLSSASTSIPLAPAVVHFADQETKPFHEAILDKIATNGPVFSVRLDVNSEAVPIPDHETASGADVLYLFTSGSTGSPKCVPVTRSDLFDRVMGEINAFKLTPDDRLLNILPFSFDVGCNQLFSSLAAGCTLVIQNSWLARDILDTIDTLSISGISGVPSIWETLLATNLDELRSTLAAVRYITVSGGALSKKHLDLLRDIAPDLDIIKTYGQTETFRSSLLAPEFFDTKRLSVGRPFQGAEFFVIRDDGSKAAAGETGEIVHRGVGTMRGYLGESDPSGSGKLRPNPFDSSSDKQSVVFTGDYGEVDADGFLYIQGRSDRMMKIRGNRVYPEEVERKLIGLPGILDAVVACVYVNNGTVLTAALVADDEKIRLAELGSQLARILPSYMVPEEIHVVNEFPRTPSGKTDLGAVTAMMTAKASEASPSGET